MHCMKQLSGATKEWWHNCSAFKPSLVDALTIAGSTTLQYAAYQGHGRVVAQLLAANPSLIDVYGYGDQTALHAVMALRPNLVCAVGSSNWTVCCIVQPIVETSRMFLTTARCFFFSCSRLAWKQTQLLAACPALIDVVMIAGLTKPLSCLQNPPRSMQSMQRRGNTISCTR